MNVAVIGGGVAGSVTALELAKAGATVTIIEREANAGWKIGEGLPPVAKPLLQRLGVWERFVADEHLASYGNCSAWGSSELVDQSFVFNPYGNGWHLDRSRFDKLLLSAAIEAGAKLSSSDDADALIADADFVVDASGRNSGLARRQGARRINVDNLVAVAALLKAGDESLDQDSLTMVEAVAEGWWYAALLPNAKLVVVYLSDADLDSSRLACSTAGWMKLLGQTCQLQKRIEQHDYRIEQHPRIVSANSSRLDQVIGDNWLAVGDAAAAFDPLSSQGIVTAMEFGILAAKTILSRNFSEYSKQLDQAWGTYLNNRNLYYSQERRWPDSMFWLRRHGAPL